MTSSYVETNEDILQHIFTQLRWYILEEKLNMSTSDPVQSMIQSVYGSHETDPNAPVMISLLGEPICFDTPETVINQDNYYVVKNRLTKYEDDIVENETRAGYMYVLVKRKNHVSVSFFYVHDSQGLTNTPESKKWVQWQHSDEGWIVYDGDNGHFRGYISGCLYD